MKYVFWKILGILAIVAFLLVGCDSSTSSKSGSSSSTQAKPYTLAADQVTTSSAVLKGRVTMGSTVAPDLKIGFQYSKSAGIMPSNSTTVEVTDTDASYNFSTEITGLEPSTTYYFRSFVHQNGADTYGATMSFTTKDLVIALESLDASDIKSSSATLKAKLDLTDVIYTSLEYGFYWGTSETSQDKKLDGGRIINNEYSALLTDLEPNTRYWFKAYAKLDGQTSYGVVKTFTTEDIPTPDGAVDLGIVMTRPDGTKYNLYWATCNLCKDGFVSSPEKYGDYYAWGETEPKDTYSWSTYKFGTSDFGPFSKYNTNSSYGAVDNKTVLETGPNGDDVASKKLGGKWRMPTDEEWTALRTNCTWTWTSNYNNTGIAGRIVKSNVSGYTDKSIFLPAAGSRSGTTLSYAGSLGYYWSSSLDTDYPYYAWTVNFYSGYVYRYFYDRRFGQSVRPVSE